MLCVQYSVLSSKLQGVVTEFWYISIGGNGLGCNGHFALPGQQQDVPFGFVQFL